MQINLYKFLWKFIIKKKWLFISLVVFILINESINTFGTQHFNKIIFNSLNSGSINFNLLVFYIVVYALCFNLSKISDRFEDKLSFESKSKTQMKIRDYLFNYTIQHSMNYFNNSFSGDLNNKINNIVNDCGKFIDTFNTIIVMGITLLLTPIFYANINIYISLLFIIISIIFIVSLLSIKKILKQKAKILAETKSKFIGTINDDFVNISNIKIFANEKKESQNTTNAINQVDEANYEYLKIFIRFKAINFIVVFLLLFFIVGFAGILLVQRKIDFGTFIFITIVTSIMRFILDEITDKLLTYSELSGKLENNLTKILQPVDIQNKNTNKLVTNNGKIEFKHINFSYKRE